MVRLRRSLTHPGHHAAKPAPSPCFLSHLNIGTDAYFPRSSSMYTSSHVSSVFPFSLFSSVSHIASVQHDQLCTVCNFRVYDPSGTCTTRLYFAHSRLPRSTLPPPSAQGLDSDTWLRPFRHFGPISVPRSCIDTRPMQFTLPTIFCNAVHVFYPKSYHCKSSAM